MPTLAKKRGIVTIVRDNEKLPALTQEEYDYWYDILQKIAKIGTEFEFNLPEASDIEASVLECANDVGCSSECQNTDQCLSERRPALCATRSALLVLGSSLENLDGEDEEFTELALSEAKGLLAQAHIPEEATCAYEATGDHRSCLTCPYWALDCRLKDCAWFTPQCVGCQSFSPKKKGNLRLPPGLTRKLLHQELSPSRNLAKVGDSGVLDVRKDGSLVGEGGAEVPTVGRRVSWNSLYYTSKRIIDALTAKGAYVDHRCGQHFHLLTGYYESTTGMGQPNLPNGQGVFVNELEKPMPQIILANFHQLCRFYELPMFWITSAGDRSSRLTRWARFRQSIYRFSAWDSNGKRARDMREVISEIKEVTRGLANDPHSGKYAAISYYYTKFNKRGEVERFHIENRIPDGCQSATAVTAWGLLTYALLLKAVRLSQYGLLKWIKPNKAAGQHEARRLLIQKELGSWDGPRYAETEGLAQHYDLLVSQALGMVDFLKPELAGQGPAYEALVELAKKPVSLRRAEGQSWEQIEEELSRPWRARRRKRLQERIIEAVEMGVVSGYPQKDIWIDRAASTLRERVEEVASVVDELLEEGFCVWNEDAGSIELS